MKHKNAIVAILAALLCVSLLTGCLTNNPTQTVASKIPTADVQDPVTEKPIFAESFIEDDIPSPETSIIPSQPSSEPDFEPSSMPKFDQGSVPPYSGRPYATINQNRPFFSNADLTTESYEHYGDFDDLGRCTAAWACIGADLMPTEPRREIGQVKPTGWHTVRYDEIIDGKYLYNRCHLIGYQLSGENANTKNLITGTRYLNTEGMLPFENQVAEYVKSTENHVMYRVTPIFENNNLLASGVLMEAQSIETNDICFCVYAYNIQPDVEIDYATGDSRLANNKLESNASPSANPTPLPTQIPPKNSDPLPAQITNSTAEPVPKSTAAPNSLQADYIGNTNTMKFHRPGCSSVENMNNANKFYYTGTRDEMISMGYAPCQRCRP